MLAKNQIWIDIRVSKMRNVILMQSRIYFTTTFLAIKLYSGDTTKQSPAPAIMQYPIEVADIPSAYLKKYGKIYLSPNDAVAIKIKHVSASRSCLLKTGFAKIGDLLHFIQYVMKKTMSAMPTAITVTAAHTGMNAFLPKLISPNSIATQLQANMRVPRMSNLASFFLGRL